MHNIPIVASPKWSIVQIQSMQFIFLFVSQKHTFQDVDEQTGVDRGK